MSKPTKICSRFCFAPSFAISIQKCQSSYCFLRKTLRRDCFLTRSHRNTRRAETPAHYNRPRAAATRCQHPISPGSPELQLRAPHPLTSRPPRPQTWSGAPGHPGSPAAPSHGKSLQSKYSTPASIVTTVYSLGAFAADQREEKDGRRAACAFVRHRKYVTVHPTHRQALPIRFSHQRDARGKTNIIPPCLFRTAETLELILGLLEIQDFQLFVSRGGRISKGTMRLKLPVCLYIHFLLKILTYPAS